MAKKKVAFFCVHNSCRSQIAEALGKHLASDDNFKAVIQQIERSWTSFLFYKREISSTKRCFFCASTTATRGAKYYIILGYGSTIIGPMGLIK